MGGAASQPTIASAWIAAVALEGHCTLLVYVRIIGGHAFAHALTFVYDHQHPVCQRPSFACFCLVTLHALATSLDVSYSCTTTCPAGRSALGDAMKVTKCVTIHTFKPDVLPTSSEKWVNCFSLAPSAQQALNTKSELESANLSHMLLRINVPSQQAYHLPMLITPAFCVYLITFDLRVQKESLSKIHNAMKDVYTLSTYRSEAGDTDLPKVLLVGMYADEAKDKGLFAQKLNTRLEKMPYDRLVERPVGDEPFWAVDGGNLSLSGNDALSQQVQSYHSRHKVEVHRWIVHLCELEEKLQEKLQRAPYMCYSELKEEVDTSNFDACLHFLHNYGFIFYHSVKVEEAVGEGRAGQGRQGADEVVVLQPQYLCNLFAKVQEFSATKKRLTVADLLSRTGASTEATAEHRQWFQRICIDMGLVVAVRLDYIFLMGLKGGIPSCPPREEYSVPPLLMTFRDSKHFTVEPEYLLPSYFFAVFVTEFLRILAQQSGPQPQALVMEQHYMEVKKGTTAIHIVERDFCIEIGLQQLDVGKLAPEKKKTNLNTTCKDIKKVVVESAENIATRLKLASSNIRYGCYHTCETEEGPLDSFGEFCPQSTELGGPYLECFCCDGGVQPTTPLQRIWFLEDFPLGEVRVCCVARSACSEWSQVLQWHRACMEWGIWVATL